MALPSRVRLPDDPAASHVTLSRAVTPLNMLKHTAPYQQDRSAATLEAQALGGRQPAHGTDDAADGSVPRERGRVPAAHLLVGEGPEALGGHRRGPATTEPRPAADGARTPGKEKFDDFCGRCHGGPAQVQNLENRIFPPFDGSTNPVSINVVVSNPPPNGFPSSLIQGPGFDLPTQRFSVDLPNGTSVVLESSDPGTVLTDARALETVGGNQVFNRFDIPQLRGINETAPYFHDHRAKTLEEVVKHYQSFFFFINVVRGFPLP